MCKKISTLGSNDLMINHLKAKKKWVKFTSPKTNEPKMMGRKEKVDSGLKYGQFLVSILDFWGLPSDKIQRNWKLYHVFIPLETFFGIGWNWKTRFHPSFPSLELPLFVLQSLFYSWWLQPMWKIWCSQNGNLPQKYLNPFWNHEMGPCQL